MALRRRRGMDKEPPELDITTFLNLMVVLIPFLLISAVFSRITIMELDVPAGAGGGKADKPKLELEIIVRKSRIEIGNGKRVVAKMDNIDEQYDLKKLSAYLQDIKKKNPEKTDVTVLMESKLEYEFLINVMDTTRSVTLPPPSEGAKPKVVVLFPDISVGDAP